MNVVIEKVRETKDTFVTATFTENLHAKYNLSQ